jgi:NADPH-dependent FMN reductase
MHGNAVRVPPVRIQPIAADDVARAVAKIATGTPLNGVPGVLKNAIDWLSRPPRDSALNGKVAALTGASPGITGTARAQSQLRQAFVFTNTHALLQPEVLVGHAQEKFDADGHLVHEATRDFLATFLQHSTGLIALHAMTATTFSMKAMRPRRATTLSGPACAWRRNGSAACWPG